MGAIEKSSSIDEKLDCFIEIKTGLEEAQEKMSLAVEQSTNSMTQGVTALRAERMMLKSTRGNGTLL